MIKFAFFSHQVNFLPQCRDLVIISPCHSVNTCSVPGYRPAVPFARQICGEICKRNCNAHSRTHTNVPSLSWAPPSTIMVARTLCLCGSPSGLVPPVLTRLPLSLPCPAPRLRPSLSRVMQASLLCLHLLPSHPHWTLVTIHSSLLLLVLLLLLAVSPSLSSGFCSPCLTIKRT